MEEYLKREKRKRIKRYCIGVIISILLVIILALTYLVYFQIDINTTPTNLSQQTTDVTKLSQTVEQVEKQDKTITEVIEQVNEAIVGISKLKNSGTTIFLEDGTSELGLGTGMIVSENGYILTNEHVSGGKYSNCYVTLSTGKSYQGNVVWSDSTLDLAIVKINSKNLPFVTLGDSSNVKVGQSVYRAGQDDFVF